MIGFVLVEGLSLWVLLVFELISRGLRCSVLVYVLSLAFDVLTPHVLSEWMVEV